MGRGPQSWSYGMSPEEKARCEEAMMGMIKKGVPYRKIAEAFGCSLTTVTNLKKRINEEAEKERLKAEKHGLEAKQPAQSIPTAQNIPSEEDIARVEKTPCRKLVSVKKLRNLLKKSIVKRVERIILSIH